MKKILANGVIVIALAGLLWRIVDSESFLSALTPDQAGSNPSVLLILGLAFGGLSYLNWRWSIASKGVSAFDGYFKIVLNITLSLVCFYLYFFVGV